MITLRYFNIRGCVQSGMSSTAVNLTLAHLCQCSTWIMVLHTWVLQRVSAPGCGSPTPQRSSSYATFRLAEPIRLTLAALGLDWTEIKCESIFAANPLVHFTP